MADAPPEDCYSPALMTLCRVIGLPFLYINYRLKVEGQENIPETGAAILAANHGSYLDPIVMSGPIRRPIRYLAWKNLFSNPAFAWVISRLGAIPLDTKLRTDRVAYEAGLRVLEEGNLLCIYPEGERSFDNQVGPLQPGVARLAIASGAPIIPVVITGAFDAWSRTRKYPRLFARIHIRILPPLIAKGAVAGAERRREAERLTQELAEALRGSLPKE